MKKILSLILAISMFFALAACGGDMTMEQVINASIEALGSVHSTHVSASVGIDVASGDTTTIGMECDIDIDNNLYYATVDTTANGESQIMDMYIRMGDVIDLYMSYNDQWIKMEGISKDLLGGVGANSDVRNDFKFYYDAMLANENATFGTTELEGKEYYSITAPVSLKSLEDAKKFSIDSLLSTYIEDTSDLAAVAEALSDAPALDVTIYINKDTYLPYGFTVDFNKLLAAIAGEEVNQAYSAAVYTDYDDVSITIPDEALNGLDLSALSQQN